MRRAVVGLAVVAALAVAAAGCGGGGEKPLSKEDYEQRVAAIGKDIEARFSDLGAASIDPSNLGALSDLLAKLADALDDAAGRVGDLVPPEEVEATQEKLVQAARELADLVREVADKIKNAPLAELVQIQDKLDVSKSDAFRRLQQAIQEFKDKGYDLGEIGS